MVGWHHRLNGHKFEQALGVGDGQEGLAFCSPWGRKLSDPTVSKLAPLKGLPMWLSSKESARQAGDLDSIPGSRRSPGEGNVTYSSILARRISRTEEAGGLHGVHGVAKSRM